MLSNLSKIIPLLDDPKDFVRIAAVEMVSKATDDKEIQLALLKTAVADRTALAPNSVRNAIQTSLLKSEAAVSKTPFQAGYRRDTRRTSPLQPHPRRNRRRPAS